MPELPIRPTVAEAYRTIFSRGRALLIGLVVPVAILVILNLSEGYIWQLTKAALWSGIWILISEQAGLKLSIVDFFRVLSSALYLIPITYFGVAWQSALLVNSDQDNTRPTVAWSQSHTKFMSAAFLLWLLAMLLGIGYVIACAVMAPTFIGFLTTPFSFYSPFQIVVFILAVMLGSYVFARLSFILPTANLGIAWSLSTSLRQTRDHGERLVVILIVALIPLFVVQFCVSLVWMYLSPLRASFCGADHLDSRVRDIVASACATKLPLELIGQTFQFLCLAVVLTVIWIVYGKLLGGPRRSSVDA